MRQSEDYGSWPKSMSTNGDCPACDSPLTFHTTEVCISRSESNTCLGRQYPLADSIHLILQALVYHMLPSTTAVFSYAIESRKLSANEQFFCWCSNRSKFVTNNSNNIRRLFYNWPCCLGQSNKTKIVWIETELFFFYPGWMRLMFTCMLGRWVVFTVLSVPEPFGGRWPEIKSAPSVA